MYEGQQEHLVVEQLAEQTQSLFHISWRLKHTHRSLVLLIKSLLMMEFHVSLLKFFHVKNRRYAKS